MKAKASTDGTESEGVTLTILYPVAYVLSTCAHICVHLLGLKFNLSTPLQHI